ncbi:transglutaminase family protein [Allosphingosinicella sp.]|uniref:transglutaminase-like domain-containing protein n=1 Tax=Allosphingosinicella sp. TaxID=2823234 RepID=UPI00378414C4
MRLQIDVTLDYHMPAPADVLLAVEVAQLPDQRLREDRLIVDGAGGPLTPVAGEDGIGQRTWLRADGPLHATYRATVDVTRTLAPIGHLPICPLASLPPEAIAYLWPSRYCESDRFETFVEQSFGQLAGGAKLLAMRDWIEREMAYVPGTSDASTTAADAFLARQGVCRDYAHLMAAFARAAGVPARLTSVYALGLEPPDFHAVVEVWLDGAWHFLDATGLAPAEGFARIGVGRDATDIAFMTIFGSAVLNRQSVRVSRLPG